MGRHVNFADEQERWLNKAEKLTRKPKNQRLEDKDPNSLTLAEQLELERRRNNEREKLSRDINIPTKKEETRYSHYKPKQ
jgi:hypothetical protein